MPDPQVPPLRYHPRVWGLLAWVLGALLVLGLALVALIGGVVWLWWIATNPVQPGLILWALVGTMLVGMWCAPLVGSPVRPKGFWLTPIEAPELFKLLDTAWRAAGIPGTPRIDLAADASLRLALPGSLGQALLGQPRVLQVGMALLNDVTAQELAGLAAARAGEWGARGYGVGGFVTRTLQGFEALGGNLGAGGCLQLFNPLYWLVAGLAQLLQRPALLRDLSWQRPLYADAQGVAVAGSMVYHEAVDKAALNEAIFESTAYHVVFDLMEQGKQLTNLFVYYAEQRAQVEPMNLNLLREGLFAEPGEAAVSGLPAGVTLPTLAQRLARVMHLPWQEHMDKRPARDLLVAPEALEERLTQGLTTGLDLAMATARAELWEESQREIAIMKDEYEGRQ